MDINYVKMKMEMRTFGCCCFIPWAEVTCANFHRARVTDPSRQSSPSNLGFLSSPYKIHLLPPIHYHGYFYDQHQHHLPIHGAPNYPVLPRPYSRVHRWVLSAVHRPAICVRKHLQPTPRCTRSQCPSVQELARQGVASALELAIGVGR
jgi:hypothetical protein